MQIIGGFAGHGTRNGVTVEQGTFRRVCNDCGYQWPHTDDEIARVNSVCLAADRASLEQEVARVRAAVKRT